jgi:hypothetical protein
VPRLIFKRGAGGVFQRSSDEGLGRGGVLGLGMI